MLNEKLQQKVERIVKNEVLTCQSMLVEELFKKEVCFYDDIENLFLDNSEKIEELQNKVEELEEKIENNELTEGEIEKTENKINDLQNEIDELENEEEEPQEIYEWWLVSDWLTNKLKEYGEPILETDFETWWGRTCTGQSIELDYVIQKIVMDIENKYNK